MYDLLGLPSSTPAAQRYLRQMGDKRPLQMKRAYAGLLEARNSSPEVWRTVHRILPKESKGQLLMACLEQGWRVAVETMLALMAMPTENTSSVMLSFMQRDDGWRDMVEQLLALTETPAMFFVRLGDGIDFDERDHRAVFGSRESVQRFRKRYPAWTINEGYCAE